MNELVNTAVSLGSMLILPAIVGFSTLFILDFIVDRKIGAHQTEMAGRLQNSKRARDFAKPVRLR